MRPQAQSSKPLQHQDVLRCCSELACCPAVSLSFTQYSKYSVNQKTHLWFQYKVFTTCTVTSHRKLQHQTYVTSLFFLKPTQVILSCPPDANLNLWLVICVSSLNALMFLVIRLKLKVWPLEREEMLNWALSCSQPLSLPFFKSPCSGYVLQIFFCCWCNSGNW